MMDSTFCEGRGWFGEGEIFGVTTEKKKTRTYEVSAFGDKEKNEPQIRR